MDGVPVPNGFHHLEGTKETGFVIKNDTDENEFVWVPVAGMGYEYNRGAWVGNNTAQVSEGIEDESKSEKIKQSSSEKSYYIESIPEDEKASVESYGGYYIARYEAGIRGGERRSIDTSATVESVEKESGKPLSQKDKYQYNYVTRIQAQGLAENMYVKEIDKVTSKLCSSYAWDTALKFIQTQNTEYPTNSIGGNYSSVLQKTGQDTTHPCNIYDMGGSVWEWTTEYSPDFHYGNVSRGGDYQLDGYTKVPASCRYGSSWDTANTNIGFRVTLYL